MASIMMLGINVCSTLLSAVGTKKAQQLEEYRAAMSQERANHAAALQVGWHTSWLTQRACDSAGRKLVPLHLCNALNFISDETFLPFAEVEHTPGCTT